MYPKNSTHCPKGHKLRRTLSGKLSCYLCREARTVQSARARKYEIRRKLIVQLRKVGCTKYIAETLASKVIKGII